MPDAVNTPQSTPSFRQQHGLKLVGLLFWLALLIGYWLYSRQNDLTVAEGGRRVAGWLTGSWYGPGLYIIMYALRPLLFIPATLITLLSGFLFGPLWGVLYTVIGSNSSAMLAYGVGRYFGQGVLDAEQSGGLIQKYARRLRESSFEAVLIMRLIFLPYDLVHYIAGFLKIDWRAFLLATIIGSIPGTISIVLLGASFGTLEELMAGEIRLNPATLFISIALIGVSLGISRLLKKGEN
ncbi:MAG: TVP38/TMEM64 family protein [Anaerolineae bacterium]|nr:TVP38/TMEM64 family protein [Anaerolineae bacterium]